ncbi:MULTISPECIES: hypothetical protein [unclassified Actinomyces]|uniref:hypothetical protein n=1 Tax=unclassified Actinomyces TaxID=2609248 RepID=UPI0020179A00|nr:MULTISPECIES: hypothetical protein [unclassified Actinomyces]MCL3777269.1 hypothetical protein [Actinomyces sp. AC-20-1]MCL3789919.1 hypothetical protein [Actinomyces sp. 187325]MCL3792135.1 hypothetical protein [Actinomyces sp. 186855]MCL3793631.1 hypothetical protein [Actinomyces sp. 217892]
MSEQASRRRRLVRLGTSALVLLMVLGMVLSVVSGALAAPSGAAGSPGDPATGTVTAETGKPAPVVLIATTGLSWGDLVAEHAAPLDGASLPDPQGLTETLLSLTRESTPANLVQRTASATTCPADAWLSLSAGARTRALPSSPGPGQDCAWPAGWQDAVAASRQAGYGARPGALADALAQAGLSTLAVGRGASLMLTTSDGGAPASAPSLSQAVSDTPADLTVVDAADRRVLLESLRVAAGLEGARVVVASIADPADPGLQALVLPRGTTGWEGTGAVPAGAVIRADEEVLLASPSTRQQGLVQLADLSATVLTALGGEVPASMTGRALTLPGSSPAVALEPLEPRYAPLGVMTLAHDALHAEASQLTTLPVGGALVLAALACVVVAAVVLRGPAGRRRLHAVGIAATCVAALPLGTWMGAIIPWWRAGASAAYEPGWQVVPAALAATAATALSFLGLLHGACAAVTALRDHALRTRATGPSGGRRPGRLGLPGSPQPLTAPLLTTVLLALVTAVVLLTDAATGAPLGFNGVLGMNAVVAGRFYGLSNTAFALAAAALVVAVGAVAGSLVEAQPSPALRRTAALVGVGVPGVAALLVVGLPSLGADVGGTLTLVAALAALAAGLAGSRITWKQWLGVGVVAVAVVGVFGFVDHVTGSGTHMGRFVGQLQDGTAATTIRRKAWALVAPFTSSTPALVALVIGVLLIAVAWWWLARERRAWRAGASGYAPLVAPAHPAQDRAGGAQGLVLGWFGPVLRALLVLVVVEVLVNDSGASMAVLSAACSAPLLLALGCARLRARAR